MLSDPQLSSLAMDQPAGPAMHPDDEQAAPGEERGCAQGLGRLQRCWFSGCSLTADKPDMAGAVHLRCLVRLQAGLPQAMLSPSFTLPPAPPRAAPRRGLFACFARPAVRLADPDWSHNGSARSGRERSMRGGSARGGSARGCSALPARGSRSVHAGLSASLGGSERSVRSGAPRDPSVRGCRRATSVGLLYEGDSALWTPAELGRAPSLAVAGSSRSSSSSVHRASPRSLADGLYGVFGHSVASMSSGAPAPPSKKSC